MNNLDLLKFIVATVDNIDFLQRHSMVYCGDQGRSWHGTTVQVMQPNNMTKVTLLSDAGEESSAQHSSLVVSAETSGAGFSAIAGDHPSALPGGVLSGTHAGAGFSAIAGGHPSALPGGVLSGTHAGAGFSAIAGDHPSALPVVLSSSVLQGAHAGGQTSGSVLLGALAGDHPSAVPGGILSSAHAGGVQLAFV